MSLFKHLGKKKMLISALISTLLFSALAGSLLVHSANANPIGYWFPWNPPPSPIIKVHDLNTDKHTLTFSAYKAGPWITPYGMEADYDNGPYREWDYSISVIHVYVDGKLWSGQYTGTAFVSGSASLEGVSNGWHTLEITAIATAQHGTTFSSTGSSGIIEFLIDNITPPKVQVQSLKDATVNEGDFQFALRVDGRSLSWVGYSVDGKGNVTINQADLLESSLGPQGKFRTGSLTLTGLSSGLHNLVFYAKDQFGQTGASNPKEFTVGKSEVEESGVAEETLAASFPTTSIGAAIIASVALVSFGLAAYFVRRDRRRSED